MKNIKLLIISIIIVLISGCQLLPENTHLRSYRVLVQQGNVIDESKVDSLKINMTKEQVKFLLGEPVINNIFNKNRWDYVYYRKREPEETKLNMISIFFKDEIVVSMKRISKNDSGLFEITKVNKDLPEFTNENITAAIEDSIFDEIALQSEDKKKKDEKNENLKSDDFVEKENNEGDEAVEKIKTEIAKDNIKESNETKKIEDVSTKNISNNNYEEIVRKSDYEIVESVIQEWKKSWENKDTEKYFSYYLDDYTSEYFNDHNLWKEDRLNRIQKNSNINIKISNLEIVFNIDADETSYVSFKQEYKSKSYSDTVVKRIILIKKNNKWKIISEKILGDI